MSDIPSMHGKIQKLRFIAMGCSLGLATLAFFMGAFWITSVFNAVDKSRIDDTNREIRSRLLYLRQLLSVEMQLVDFSKVKLLAELGPKSDPNNGLNNAQGFDAFFIFNRNREISEVVRKDSKGHFAVESSAPKFRNMLPKNSSIFDHAMSERITSGIFLIEGKPNLIGLRAIFNGEDLKGFALAARRLDLRRLAPTAVVAEQSFDMFVPDPKVAFPSDVEEANKSMFGDEKSISRVVRRGSGLGYLRFDDVFEQTAFVLRYKWSDATTSSDRKSLGWLLVFSMVLGGLVHLISSGAITWIVRKRKQIPGLAGLSDWEFNATVESFPGYAFALNKDGQYIAVSRSFAGKLGKEPSEFEGKAFGSVAFELGFHAVNNFELLSSSKEWPAVNEIKFEVKGLGKTQKFEGSSHFIPQRNVVFFTVLDCLISEDKTVLSNRSQEAA